MGDDQPMQGGAAAGDDAARGDGAGGAPRDAEVSRRRGFFRELMARALEPVADRLAGFVEEEIERSHLRPPGALPEREFLDTCYRCGACVDACPVDAILPIPGGDEQRAGTPMIDPDLRACVVCTGLDCTHACPSGALRKLEHPHEINMGTAEVYDPLCVRSTGEACTLCVDHCPMGPAALRITGTQPPEVLPAGCVGCGMCQLHCPTAPKAITVKPR
jgi:ferredoxin-type protein NapG